MPWYFWVLITLSLLLSLGNAVNIGKVNRKVRVVADICLRNFLSTKPNKEASDALIKISKHDGI